MKKYVYGVLFLVSVGMSMVGCKKEIIKNPSESFIKSNNAAVFFEKKEDVLVFQNWDDIVNLEQSLEDLMNEHIELFETENAATLRGLRITVDGSPYDMSNPDSELTWESELAVDSFAMTIHWSEFQPLIDFEIDNQFNSLRKKHFDILYGDSEDERPSKINDEERVYFLTYPIYGALASLFNENATICVGDTLYKVLGNNFWVVCHFDDKKDLDKINDDNYASYEFDNRFIIYGLNDEKSTCRSNRKLRDDKVTTPVQNYRISTMMTITNVLAMPNGYFVKADTKCEIKNKKGKWKNRKTFCRVTGAATMRPGTDCGNQLFHTAWFNEQHNNKSSRTGRYYAPPTARPFRIKGGEFVTLHEGGVGSNYLLIQMTMD